MDFLNIAYPQAALSTVLRSSGLKMDGTIAMPWVGDQMILLDSTGNARGFIAENQMGGVTVTDPHMNVQSLSTELPGGGQSILDSSYNQQAFTVENSIGADMVYTSDFQLESMSFESPTGETSYYSSDMELLGISEQIGDKMQYNFNSTLDTNSLPNLTEHVSSVFVQSSDTAALGSELLLDFDMDFLESGLSIFDWL